MSSAYIVKAPLPPVANPEPTWEPIAVGPEQAYGTTGPYLWSPDYDWFRDFQHPTDIKFQIRPWHRPL